MKRALAAAGATALVAGLLVGLALHGLSHGPVHGAAAPEGQVEAPTAPAPIPTTTPTPMPSPTATATPSPTPTPPPTPTPGSPSPITCQPAPAGSYATCQYHDAAGSMTFYLWVPAGYDPQQRYPLVLLLHGGGEAAISTSTPQQNRDRLLNDPYAQVWGPGFPGPDSVDVQARWPSFVVVPQVMQPGRFVDVPASQGSYTLAPQPNNWLRMTKLTVDAVVQAYRGVDPGRLYVTGLSMGGYGTWEMAERWPDEFAAAAPMCGGGDPTKAARLKDMPIWAFHAPEDDIAPVSGSRDMIAAIRAAGGHPRYSEVPGAGHGVWEDAYAILGHPTPTPGFFEWLFAQHR